MSREQLARRREGRVGVVSSVEAGGEEEEEEEGEEELRMKVSYFIEETSM